MSTFRNTLLLLTTNLILMKKYISDQDFYSCLHDMFEKIGMPTFPVLQSLIKNFFLRILKKWIFHSVERQNHFLFYFKF